MFWNVRYNHCRDINFVYADRILTKVLFFSYCVKNKYWLGFEEDIVKGTYMHLYGVDVSALTNSYDGFMKFQR